MQDLGKDVNLLILDKLDDRDLFNACKSNKKFFNLCREENFWRNRFFRIFGKHAASYKPKDRSWRNHYIKVIRDINFLNNGDIPNLEEEIMRSYNWWFFSLIVKNVTVSTPLLVSNFNYESYMKRIKMLADPNDMEAKYGVFYDVFMKSVNVDPLPVEESNEIVQNIYWLSYLGEGTLKLYGIGEYTLDYFKDKGEMWEYPKYFTPAKVMKIIDDYYNDLATENDIELFRDFADERDIDYDEEDIELGKVKRSTLVDMMGMGKLYEVTAVQTWTAGRIPQIGDEIPKDKLSIYFNFDLP